MRASKTLVILCLIGAFILAYCIWITVPSITREVLATPSTYGVTGFVLVLLGTTWLFCFTRWRFFQRCLQVRRYKIQSYAEAGEIDRADLLRRETNILETRFPSYFRWFIVVGLLLLVIAGLMSIFHR